MAHLELASGVFRAASNRDPRQATWRGSSGRAPLRVRGPASSAVWSPSEPSTLTQRSATASARRSSRRTSWFRLSSLRQIPRPKAGFGGQAALPALRTFRERERGRRTPVVAMSRPTPVVLPARETKAPRQRAAMRGHLRQGDLFRVRQRSTVRP